MVAGQVDCVAGIFVRAALPLPNLANVFDGDPFTGRHRGRHPLRNSPAMGIDLQVRNQWFERGYLRGLSSYTSGEFGLELLIKADRFESNIRSTEQAFHLVASVHGRYGQLRRMPDP